MKNWINLILKSCNATSVWGSQQGLFRGFRTWDILSPALLWGLQVSDKGSPGQQQIVFKAFSFKANMLLI